MPEATVADALDLARAHLGDDSAEVYTNVVLLPHFRHAYRELVRAMGSLQMPAVRKSAYYNLPAMTGYLKPATAGIDDLSAPTAVFSRSVAKDLPIASVNGAQVTVAGHGLNSGDEVVIFQAIAGANGLWRVTVLGPNDFLLNGAVVSGSGSGGRMSASAEQFSRLNWVDDMPSEHDQVAWSGDAFHFKPQPEPRQLRIVYFASGSAPDLQSELPIEDAIDFLAVRTAALAAASRGGEVVAARLNAMALGPNFTEAEGAGGLLRQLVAARVRELQTTAWPIRRKPFRPRRVEVIW